MSERIRVLRVMEYFYDDVATYLEDRSRWTMQSPPGWNYGKMKMQSAVVSIHMADDEGNWDTYLAPPASSE